MGVLEQVEQMRKQGATDQQIVSRLKEQNVAPKQITEALGQSQIKNAVSDENQQTQGLDQEMQSSMMPPPPKPQGTYTPRTQEIPQEDAQQQQNQQQIQQYPDQQQQYMPQQQNYQQNYYEPQNYEYEYAPETTDTSMMVEVAEQVFAEKTKKIQKKISEFNEFKTLAQSNIDNSLERLKRIESSMDKLQAAILEKVGAYGNTLEGIKKEMSMMQNSFGKMTPSIKEKHSTHHTTHKKSSSHSTKAHKKTSKKK